MQVSFKYQNVFRWTLRKSDGIGVEVRVSKGRFLYEVEVNTHNKVGNPNRTQKFYMPKKPFSGRLMRYLVNRSFRKIRHRYLEWGLTEGEAQFPWKER